MKKRINPENVKTAYYDSVDDLLYVRFKENNYAFSEQRHGVIFDLNKKKEIIGFEIFNASKFFEVPKTFLKNVRRAQFEIVIKKNDAHLRSFFISQINNKQSQRTRNESFANSQALQAQKVECTALLSN